MFHLRNEIGKAGDFIFEGSFIHSVSKDKLEFIEDGRLVVVDSKIASITTKNAHSINELQKQFNIPQENIVKLSSKQFLVPGFIDTHIHAPQYPNIGLGYDLPLLEWLDAYTFPLEKKFNDETFARLVYEAVVKKSLRCGTTTASYYGTIHGNTTLILAETAMKLNQRAFVGKVNMNSNSPSDYIETTEESIKATESFLNEFSTLPSTDLVQPVITPRFAISCNMELMTKLGELANKHNVRIQTHVSENKSEVESVANLYPDCANYCDVYDKAGLLTNKTILAHGIYLLDDELAVLKERDTAISHCANSNLSLRSGLCPVRHILDYGIKMGLGTDCAGGYGMSILDSIRRTLETSISRSMPPSNLKPLSIPEVFYMATLGGAQAVGLDNDVGNLTVGKRFDALIIDLSTLDLLENYSLEQLFQKFIYLADDRHITQVYVNGQLTVDK